jgi:hypothetical protein
METDYVVHFVVMPVTILPPALPPTLTQLHWKHLLSFSKSGLGLGVQTFVVGIQNPNKKTALYARALIEGFDSTGARVFTTTSTTLKLLPGQSILNIRLTENIPQSDIGDTMAFTVTLDWGMNQHILNLTSDLALVPNTGTFSVES